MVSGDRRDNGFTFPTASRDGSVWTYDFMFDATFGGCFLSMSYPWPSFPGGLARLFTGLKRQRPRVHRLRADSLGDVSHRANPGRASASTTGPECLVLEHHAPWRIEYNTSQTLPRAGWYQTGDILPGNSGQRTAPGMTGRLRTRKSSEGSAGLWILASGKETFCRMTTGDRLYLEREGRFNDVVALRKPDRVPVIPAYHALLPTQIKGVSNKEAGYDCALRLRAVRAVEFGWDMCPRWGVFVPSVRSPDHSTKWPGGSLADEAPLVVEGEYLRAEEYDEFIANPDWFTCPHFPPYCRQPGRLCEHSLPSPLDLELL